MGKVDFSKTPAGVLAINETLDGFGLAFTVKRSHKEGAVRVIEEMELHHLSVAKEVAEDGEGPCVDCGAPYSLNICGTCQSPVCDDCVEIGALLFCASCWLLGVIDK